MTKYFMTSVADARLYDSSDNLVGTAKTLMDSSVEVSLSNTDVRGGKGNALQYILFNGADMNVTLSETQFSLDFLQQSLGSTLGTGVNVFSEETITLGAGGTGTVTGTPLAYQGTTIYGWLTPSSGTVERVTFTGSNFTSGVSVENDVVCVRYYNLDSAARQITIGANIVPSILRLEMETQLASSSDSSNVIGKVVFTVPNFTLSGNFSFSMTPDGVSETAISGRALAYTPSSGSCSNVDVLGYITRVIDDANWYDTAVALAITGGDFTLSATLGTQLLTVRAVHSDGSVSLPPVADLTFASATTAASTVSSAGLVTGVAAGTSDISVTITSKPAIDAHVICTTPA